MAGDGHDAAQALDNHVIGRFFRLRPGVAEARGGGVDQPRVAGVQRFPAQAEFFHCAGAEVFHQHVGVLQQALKDGPVLRLFQVQRDGFLAAVDGGEIERVAMLERAVGARIVALRGFHLNDAGAELVQQQGAVGAGQDARQIQDQGAAQRAGAQARHLVIGHCLHSLGWNVVVGGCI